MKNEVTQIRMTHENGLVMNLVRRNPKDVEKTITLAKKCGYVKFEFVKPW
jgi:hypothetical protein